LLWRSALASSEIEQRLSTDPWWFLQSAGTRGPATETSLRICKRGTGDLQGKWYLPYAYLSNDLFHLPHRQKELTFAPEASNLALILSNLQNKRLEIW